MKVFFVSQGAGLRVFHEVARILKAEGTLSAQYHYVADRVWVERYLAAHPELKEDGEPLKEWEIVRRGAGRAPKGGEIEAWEARLDVPSLWPALIADRRLMNGPRSKLRQDYQPQYTHDQLQGIALETAECLWNSFQRVRPDVVVSFGPSTAGGVMADLVARAMGIPVFTLKATKISNFITLGDGFREEHPHIREAYRRHIRGDRQPHPEHIQAARILVEAARTTRLVYEGAVSGRHHRSILAGLWTFLTGFPRALTVDLLTRTKGAQTDPQYVSRTAWLWEEEVGSSRRITRQARLLRHRTLGPDELRRVPFLFMPLNSEPEIALSVYSRFTLNQIEVIRNVAQSLPLGWRLVLKEHPRSHGRRSDGYYHRVLEIPNVYFVPVETRPAELFAEARCTLVISSFMGFESVLAGKPCLVLGRTLYSDLPAPLVQEVRAFEDLPNLIHTAVETPWPEDADRHIESLLVAIMEESVRADLYGGLLGKAKRERGTGSEAVQETEEQFVALARHLLDRLALKGAPST
ncbi:MAG: hypothetical protein WEA09_03965 [Gemmatimonadota bacterium]